jgi:hypothetical protein
MDLLNKSKVRLVCDFRRDLVEEYLRVRSYRKVADKFAAGLDNNKKSTNLHPQFLYHHVCVHPGF